MSKSIIPDDDKKGFTLAFTPDNVEYVNSIEYYASGFKEKNKVITKQLLKREDRFLTSLLLDEFFEKRPRKVGRTCLTNLSKLKFLELFLICSLQIQKKIKLNF